MMLMALAMAAAVEGGPDEAMLGRYAVRDGAGRTVCTLTFTYEPDVGGEVEPGPDCKGRLADAARWFEDGAGGFRLNDPVRGRVAEVTEDEAGYTLRVEGKGFGFVKLDAPRMKTPAERAAGWWTAYDVRNPTKVLCRLELKAGGAVGPAAACPSTLRGFGGGQWTASEATVRLRKGGKSRDFSWADAASLLSVQGTLGLNHD